MSNKQTELFEEAKAEAEAEREAMSTEIVDFLIRGRKDYSNVPHGANNDGIAYAGEEW